MGGGVVASSEGDGKKRSATIDATAGALAGCLARFAVGPLDVVKIRLQVQREPTVRAAGAASKYSGFSQALRTIYREEGVRGLWRGTVPGLLLTVPYTAVQFVSLQQIRKAAANLGLTGVPHASEQLLHHAQCLSPLHTCT